MLEELKNANHNDIEDMVYRMQLTFDEIIDKPNRKCFAGSLFSFTGIYKSTDYNLMLKSLVHNEVKVNNTIDDLN